MNNLAINCRHAALYTAMAAFLLLLLFLAPTGSASEDQSSSQNLYDDEIWGHCQGTCNNNEDEQPDLRLYRDSTYWASYADFQHRLLSVDYHVRNFGPGTLYRVRFIKSNADQGIKTKTHLPLRLACSLEPGATVEFTVAYKLPPGITTFMTSNYAMAKNSCDRPLFYPSPPGLERSEEPILDDFA